jgi:predicted short-subunit dehydrogenase-like oxidoreductase (DUF2520 family)
MSARSIFIVGAGRMASALARGLGESGWTVAAYAHNARGRARLRRLHVPCAPLPACATFDLVFLAVPDDEIVAATRSVRPHLRRGQVVAHGAGALTLAPLASVRGRGAHAGSLHPMQALADGRFAPGITAAIDGDPVARRLLSRAAADLGLSPVRVPARGRALYHLASTISANLCMALADLAVDAWVASGAPPKRALTAIVPIMRGAVENLARHGLPDALTGPVSRGDAVVVARHLAALRGDPAEVYRLLSSRLVALAERRGLDPTRAAQVRGVLARDQGGDRDMAGLSSTFALGGRGRATR